MISQWWPSSKHQSVSLGMIRMQSDIKTIRKHSDTWSCHVNLFRYEWRAGKSHRNKWGVSINGIPYPKMFGLWKIHLFDLMDDLGVPPWLRKLPNGGFSCRGLSCWPHVRPLWLSKRSGADRPEIVRVVAAAPLGTTRCTPEFVVLFKQPSSF